jgi:hypothetical protein
MRNRNADAISPRTNRGRRGPVTRDRTLRPKRLGTADRVLALNLTELEKADARHRLRQNRQCLSHLGTSPDSPQLRLLATSEVSTPSSENAIIGVWHAAPRASSTNAEAREPLSQFSGSDTSSFPH